MFFKITADANTDVSPMINQKHKSQLHELICHVEIVHIIERSATLIKKTKEEKVRSGRVVGMTEEEIFRAYWKVNDRWDSSVVMEYKLNRTFFYSITIIVMTLCFCVILFLCGRPITKKRPNRYVPPATCDWSYQDIKMKIKKKRQYILVRHAPQSLFSFS